MRSDEESGRHRFESGCEECIYACGQKIKEPSYLPFMKHATEMWESDVLTYVQSRRNWAGFAITLKQRSYLDVLIHK